MTTVHISSDLHSQAAAFLRDHLQETINEDDLRLVTNWISTKLEEERQGWRKKVQMSFKEVEKERKLGLTTQSSIQRIIGLFDPYLEPLYLYREPSQYHSTEADSRVGNVEQLEKNIQAILRMIDQYQEERIECLQYLNITEQDINLAEAFRKRTTKLEQQLAKTEAEWRETEQRLQKEIQTSNDALDMHTKLANDQKEKTNKEIAEMRRLLAELKVKVRHMPVPGHKMVNKGLQVNIVKKKQTRECCIQVSLDLTSDTSVAKSKSTVKNTEDNSQGNQIDITDLRPPSESGSVHPPISSITIVKQRGNSKGNAQARKVGNQVKETVPAMHTRGEALVSTSQSSSLSDFGKDLYKKSEQYAETESQQQTISFLRNQVVDFANKLDRAKHEVERYHEHVAFRKGRTNGYTQNNQPDTARSNYTSRSIYDFRHDELKGFLSGIKVKDGTHSARDHKQPIKTDSQKPIKAMLSYSGTSKCLRCNKLYKAKENTDTSCKFHTKNKRNFEKYDSTGKLQKVLQLWECCMQGPEYEGCQLGQHV